MSRPETVPEPWLSFLRELDELATAPVRLDCIGGFVVTVLYGLSRTTGDLDVLAIAPKCTAHAFAEVAGEGENSTRNIRSTLTKLAWRNLRVFFGAELNPDKCLGAVQ
jgi:hypothetical protein